MGFSGAGQPLAALLWACSRVGALEHLRCVSLGVGGLKDPGGARSTIAAGPLVAPKRCCPGPPQRACHSLCFLTCERGTVSLTVKDGGEV